MRCVSMRPDLATTVREPEIRAATVRERLSARIHKSDLELRKGATKCH